MRNLLKAGMVVVALTAAQPAVAQFNDDPRTTRIETRPFYGATVTVEHGVRVYRALPPTRHMIINPYGETPLSLGINETRIQENVTSNNNFFDNTSRGFDRPIARGLVAPGFIGRGFAPRRFGRDRRGPGRRFNFTPRLNGGVIR